MSNRGKARERFQEPAARVVWAGICALDEGMQHLILEELRERLHIVERRESPRETRAARAVAALREASELLEGRSPSVGEYRGLREAHPECGWPPDGSVRRWLGGTWNDALRAARLDADPKPQPTIYEQGPELTADEALAALLAAAEDLGCPVHAISFQAYLAWARRDDVRRRPGRQPRSQYPFQRLFGSWRGALAAAAAQVAKRGGRPGDPERAVVPAGASGQGYRYTDDELMASIDEVLGELLGSDGRRFPTATAYSLGRDRIRKREREQGLPPRAIASYAALQKRYRTWAAVKRAYRRHKRP